MTTPFGYRASTPPLWALPFAALFGACAESGAPGRATPDAGEPGDQAQPGETACEAATAAWPESPDLDDRIAFWMDEGHLPGLSACIIKAGDVVWCGAYGYTTGGGDRAVTTDTPFLWASVSKLVTATSVMMLAADGAVDLDQAIDAQLSFGARHPDGDAIRPRALLAHAGGVADNDRAMDRYYSVNMDPSLSLAAVNRRYFDPDGADYSASRNFLSEGPEVRTSYSNMGFSLLGSLVEEGAGVDFADWTADHIFTPLGMGNSGWRLADFDLATVAEPNLWQGGRSVGQGHTTFADYPNGGLRSSAHDMACFMATAARGGSLYGTRLLASDDLYEMMEPAFPALDPDQGLGWYYEDLGHSQLWVGHSGAETGVASVVFMTQDGQLGFVLVTNGDWGWEDAIYAIEGELLNFGLDL